MIVGYLDDWKTYSKLIPQMEEIVRLVKESDEKPCGRYETAWGFYMIQEGKTSSMQEGNFESHRKYADVQCLVSGSEYMEWQDIGKLQQVLSYSEEKDAEFWCGEGILARMQEGMFYVMHPRDGHKACCHINTQTEYRKIVAKIKL